MLDSRVLTIVPQSDVYQALETIYELRTHDIRGYSDAQRGAFLGYSKTLEYALRQSVQSVLMRDNHHFRRLESRAVETSAKNDLDGEHHAIHA